MIALIKKVLGWFDWCAHAETYRHCPDKYRSREECVKEIETLRRRIRELEEVNRMHRELPLQHPEDLVG